MRRLALLLAAVLPLSACGGGGDGAGAPEPATTQTATTSTGTVTEPAPEPLTTFGVYFLRDGKLAPVYRAVPQTDAVGTAAVQALLAGPTAEERSAGFSSAIPAGTELLGLGLRDRAALADFSRELEPAPGTLPAAPLAQLTFTLTQFPTVSGVWIAVQGEPVGSQSRPLRREAFGELTPLILVERPAWGEPVTSPAAVNGTASVFEATLRVRLEGPSGENLWEDTVTASEGAPGRGTFAVEIPFAASGPGKHVAFEPSANDGSPLHTFEVEVALTP